MSVVVHSGAWSRRADREPGAAAVVEVAAREPVADRVVRLTLRDPDGHRLPSWVPGAHVDLTGPTGVEGQYSLCGPLDDRYRWQVAVLDEPDGRGGSTALCHAVDVGDRLEVRGPRNLFRLVDRPRYELVAGGIGITPMLPMIEMIEAAGRPWRLTYAGRGRSAMAFAGELEDRYGDRVLVHESGRHGRLDLTHLLGPATAGVAVYCCGPASMLEAAGQACRDWPDGALHVEHFTGVDAGAAASGAAVTVRLARSDRTVHVPDGRTILDAVEDAGVAVAASCREGTCATCEVRVLRGVPDHRDVVLTPQEREAGESMMICVSRAATPELELDL